MSVTQVPSHQTRLSHLNKRGEEWNQKAQGEKAKVDQTKWNLSVVNLDGKVGINTFFEMSLLSNTGRKSSSSGKSNQLLSKHFIMDAVVVYSLSETIVG